MLQAVKATIQGESARAHRRVRAHVVKSTQSVREKLNHTAIQAGGQTGGDRVMIQAHDQRCRVSGKLYTGQQCRRD